VFSDSQPIMIKGECLSYLSSGHD